MIFQNCTFLDEVRLHIDRIDQQIIQKISERSIYVNQAAQFKHKVSEVEAPKRANLSILFHAKTQRFSRKGRKVTS